MNKEEYKSLPFEKNNDKLQQKNNIVYRKEVIYDINSLPFYNSDINYKTAVDSVMEVYNKSGILLYDSSKGEKPIFTEKDLKR